MQRLTVEGKDLLLGDEAADLLTEYAALLADRGHGDRVRLHAISGDGDEVVVTVVLSRGTTLVIESTRMSTAEPDNAAAIAYLREHIRALGTPPPVRPVADEEWVGGFDEL